MCPSLSLSVSVSLPCSPMERPLRAGIKQLQCYHCAPRARRRSLLFSEEMPVLCSCAPCIATLLPASVQITGKGRHKSNHALSTARRPGDSVTGRPRQVLLSSLPDARHSVEPAGTGTCKATSLHLIFSTSAAFTVLMFEVRFGKSTLTPGLHALGPASLPTRHGQYV